jgi:hypothetical protein
MNDRIDRDLDGPPPEPAERIKDMEHEMMTARLERNQARWRAESAEAFLTAYGLAIEELQAKLDRERHRGDMHYKRWQEAKAALFMIRQDIELRRGRWWEFWRKA